MFARKQGWCKVTRLTVVSHLYPIPQRLVGIIEDMRLDTYLLRWALVLFYLCGSYSLKLGSSRVQAIVMSRKGVECGRGFDVSGGRVNNLHLRAAEIPEFDDDEMTDDDSGDSEEEDDRTDMEKGLSHGYEGDFKKGESVRVLADCKIYSVKPFLSEGLIPKGMEGEIAELVLYGRKHKSLCSAITPIKVKFQPGGPGVPPEIERPFFLHFEASEVERLS